MPPSHFFLFYFNLVRTFLEHVQQQCFMFMSTTKKKGDMCSDQTLSAGHIFRFLFVQYVYCFVVVYFCMSDLLNASTVPGQ